MQSRAVAGLTAPSRSVASDVRVIEAALFLANFGAVKVAHAPTNGRGGTDLVGQRLMSRNDHDEVVVALSNAKLRAHFVERSFGIGLGLAGEL
jgi:hypothetical protein